MVTMEVGCPANEGGWGQRHSNRVATSQQHHSNITAAVHPAKRNSHSNQQCYDAPTPPRSAQHTVSAYHLSTQCQLAVTAHNYSTVSQHTVTSPPAHSAVTAHTVTAHRTQHAFTAAATTHPAPDLRATRVGAVVPLAGVGLKTQHGHSTATSQSAQHIHSMDTARTGWSAPTPHAIGL